MWAVPSRMHPTQTATVHAGMTSLATTVPSGPSLVHTAELLAGDGSSEGGRMPSPTIGQRPHVIRSRVAVATASSASDDGRPLHTSWHPSPRRPSLLVLPLDWVSRTHPLACPVLLSAATMPSVV